MSFDRPDQHTTVFQCDECLATVEHREGFITALRYMHADGWVTVKEPGEPWQHFCSACAPAAQAAAQQRREQERERNREKSKNARSATTDFRDRT